MGMGMLGLRTVVVAPAMSALGFMGHQLFGRDYRAIQPTMAKILAWELVAMAAGGGLTAALAKGDSGIFEGGTF